MTAVNAATAAENNPVYSLFFLGVKYSIENKTRTHEEDDTVSIFLQTFGNRIVLFLCHLLIQGEQRPRAISTFNLLPLKRVGGRI